MPDRELSSLLRPGPAAFVICLVAAAIVGQQVAPTWLVKQLPAIVETDSHERETAIAGDARIPVLNARPAAEARLVEDRLNDPSAAAGPELREELIYESNDETGERDYFILVATRHWGWWSFLPAVTAIALCFITKEPITALLGGIVVGGALIGKANILDEVLIPAIGSPRAASILILYLWLLGGLMGIWAQTGATKAFADYVSARFVRGPRSAKVVAWLLGVAFFQGGTVSSVLVGTTVRPLADKERVSHEELSLIVDATSSPIAVLLAFNAWPIYVQALIGVSGVAYLATEADRIAFFFHCIPYSFYAMFSVFFTFLLAIDRLPLAPRKLREARQRARETGQLNAPGAEPLAAGDLVDMEPPDFYAAHYADFLLPLVTLLAVAIGTYVYGGSPQVLWAFSIALLLACLLAAWKGMSLRQIVMGIIDGQKSVVLGSVILLLAITVGGLSQETGGGPFLVSLLGQTQWHFLLPATLFLVAVVISFSTGTSWATFAVTLPLAMPLAHAVGINHGLENPKLFDALCFVAALNGGVFGDQCSPISDTTVLSSMCTGADLMDHVKTQIPVALAAALLAVCGWTALAYWVA